MCLVNDNSLVIQKYRHAFIMQSRTTQRESGANLKSSGISRKGPCPARPVYRDHPALVYTAQKRVSRLTKSDARWIRKLLVELFLLLIMGGLMLVCLPFLGGFMEWEFHGFYCPAVMDFGVGMSKTAENSNLPPFYRLRWIMKFKSCLHSVLS